MKRIVFLLLLFNIMCAFAQENPAIVERLKKKYEYVSYFDNGEKSCYFIGVGNYPNMKNGACDLSGKEIVPPKYDFAQNQGDYYICWIEDKQTDRRQYGIYDLNGKMILPPEKYNYISKMGDDDIGKQYYKAVIYGPNPIDSNEGSKKALYDLKGKEIFPCIYDDIGDYWHKEIRKYGCIDVQKNGKWGICDFKGKEIVSCKYTNLYTIEGSKMIIVSEGGFNRYRLSVDSKWGVVDTNGKTIVKCEYDYIDTPSEGLFLCNKGGEVTGKDYSHLKVDGGKWGFVGYDGKVIVPFEYEYASVFKDGVAQVMKNGVSSVLVNPLSGTSMQVANGGASIKVDINIPNTGKMTENTFAFIFANENYSNLSGADYSINDGKVFKEYCHKTLGMPENNIRYYEDATFGNFNNAIKKIQDIADVYDGEAKIIFYYSGLGAADKDNISYILPTDASIATLNTTGYKVQALMDILNALNTEMTLVILDAPFSGKDKTGKMLAQNRGVAIKAKSATANGNTILCVSNSPAETARSDKKYGHSLYTYALLEKLQSSKGNCTIKEVFDYAMQWVKRESMNVFDSTQTPQVIVSESKSNMWNTIKW